MSNLLYDDAIPTAEIISSIPVNEVAHLADAHIIALQQSAASMRERMKKRMLGVSDHAPLAVVTPIISSSPMKRKRFAYFAYLFCVHLTVLSTIHAYN